MRHPYVLLASLVAASLATAACESAPATAPSADPSRVTVSSTNQPPVAQVNLTVLGTSYCGPGACVYDYEYDAYESYDPDGSIVSYEWVENGATVSSTATYRVTALRAYETCTGTQLGTLIVTDDQGATGSACYGYTPDQ